MRLYQKRQNDKKLNTSKAGDKILIIGFFLFVAKLLALVYVFLIKQETYILEI